ncbi:hypothetical protein Pelo_2959 [Pelomyxa schiedti]|nr:hypothetical protein Pelo_2959 [Pelomyxa schiedti]
MIYTEQNVQDTMIQSNCPVELYPSVLWSLYKLQCALHFQFLQLQLLQYYSKWTTKCPTYYETRSFAMCVNDRTLMLESFVKRGHSFLFTPDLLCAIMISDKLLSMICTSWTFHLLGSRSPSLQCRITSTSSMYPTVLDV